jgi:hypothetical protein
MNTKEQAVYDASLAAAYRLGHEGGCDGDFLESVLDDPATKAVMPKYGVGNLPPDYVQQLRRSYEAGLVAYEFEASMAYLNTVKA